MKNITWQEAKVEAQRMIEGVDFGRGNGVFMVADASWPPIKRVAISRAIGRELKKRGIGYVLLKDKQQQEVNT